MLKKFFDSGNRELKRCERIADKVLSLEAAYRELSDESLQAKTVEFKERIKQGETLDQILVEAFAVVKEASTRVLKMTPFRVQIIGATAIHGGNIAEMKTGEGKTLTAVMPAYLNALNGQGVHIVTVNEYLARREAEGEIGDLFRWLGLTVGLNVRDLTQEEKKEQYACDILYSTNSELGFDYLRDHMVLYAKDIVQKRGLNYAIIDEVDSILIDEARTPLIISGGAKNNANLYIQTDRFAKSLRDEDYEHDIEANSVALTPSGMEKAERVFGIENLYDLKNVTLVHHINNALKANYTMFNDKEYVVEGGEVLIVDQFTGRILKGRQFSEGLHQALEAKEGVQIKKETVTVATITYQNFFRMYGKLSGMTGTAKTEEEEFREIYNMYVVEIPTNKPVMREDNSDYIFTTLEGKYHALVEEVYQRYTLGQPILLGTVAVETSELLSKMLHKRGIAHEVLNAKQHAREAEIIAKAGHKGSVTIATNMAGRGTDIKLGEGVKELGGLAVIGSERHEARRIDNQLRGRSGRQGDPGYSRFYLSAEDELMMRFGGESFKNRIEMVTRLNVGKNSDLDPKYVPLESKMFSRFVAGAQKRIEGNNYDTRKNLLKYDDVLRRQREIVYKERTEILVRDTVEDIAKEMMSGAITQQVYTHLTTDNKDINLDVTGILSAFNGNIFPPNALSKQELENKNVNEIVELLSSKALKELENKKTSFPPEIYNEFLKVVILRVIDSYWTRHIDAMSELRQGVTLQAYAQANPLTIYQDEGYKMFTEMMANISNDVLRYIMRAQIRENLEREQVNKNITTSDGKQDPAVKRKPITTGQKVGRNDPCPCGSGKKYKYCCGQ